MHRSIRRIVRERARDRCEYCQLPQAAVEARFHVDHVVAQQHLVQAENDPTLLALACDRCNFCKGTNLTSIDPISLEVVRLYDPRQERWEEHFALEGAEIVGLTAVGRATVRLLQMNVSHRVELRERLIEEQLF